MVGSEDRIALQQVPRALRNDSQWRHRVLFALWSCAFCAGLGGLLFIAVRFHHHRSLIEVHQTGRSRPGVISRKFRHRRLRTWRHKLVYEYEVDGDRYETTTRLRPTEWKHLRVGDPIAVRYDPDRPNRSAIEADLALADPVLRYIPWLAPPAGFILLLGAYLLMRARRRDRILREGQLLEHEVLAVVSTNAELVRVRFASDGELVETVLRVPIARVPAYEVPAGDLILLRDSSASGRVEPARASHFVFEQSATDAAELLAQMIPLWREELTRRVEGSDSEALIVSAQSALARAEDEASARVAITRLDELLRDDPIVFGAFRRSLARPRSSLSAGQRRALSRLPSYRAYRERVLFIGAAAFSLVTTTAYFLVAHWVLLGPPSDVPATAAMALLSFPFYRFVLWSDWA